MSSPRAYRPAQAEGIKPDFAVPQPSATNDAAEMTHWAAKYVLDGPGRNETG